MQRLAILTAVLALALPAAPAMAATDTVDLLTEADAELDGAAADDYAGKAVAALGDVDGDGLPDLAVAAGNGELSDPSLLSPDTAAGRIYVVFGRLTPLLDLSTLASGFGIVGETPGAPLGNSVTGAGDVNGDGLDDIIVGAEEVSPLGRAAAGSAYVIFGKATQAHGRSGLAGRRRVPHRRRRRGRRGRAPVSRRRATSTATASTTSSSARPALETSGFDAGTAYVVYGRAPTPVDLDALGSGGYRIEARKPRRVASWHGGRRLRATSTATGARTPSSARRGSSRRRATPTSCSARPTRSRVPLDALGSSGYPIEGAADGDRLGASLANLGDVSGDGRPDVLVGAPDGGASYDGAAYVVFGKATTTPITVAASFGVRGLRHRGPGQRRGASAPCPRRSATSTATACRTRASATSSPVSAGAASSGAVFVVFGKPRPGRCERAR